ncbi:MAG TPA: hypothetical protein VHJ19_06120 [Gammaproteobacteria bacterium]|nr:hypothetical protein [Gammaproteobacteria bacterium]
MSPQVVLLEIVHAISFLINLQRSFQCASLAEEGCNWRRHCSALMPLTIRRMPLASPPYKIEYQSVQNKGRRLHSDTVEKVLGIPAVRREHLPRPHCTGEIGNGRLGQPRCHDGPNHQLDALERE